MKMKLQITALGILFSVNVFADGYYPELTSQDQPWTITASVGNGRYQDIYSKDGKSVMGRLALGNELMLSGDFALGLELGIQNGHQMRLNIPNETLAVLEWLPVKTTLGPMLDLLLTAKSDPLFGSSFFAQLKGGVAYRYWQMEHRPIKEKSQLAGEFQAGFGYPITALASLNVLYQGVYGNDPKPKIYTATKTASISNIPILHAVLLGLTVNL
ncbi:hypothetical protein Lmor_2965 [Legionella moravica]|uniref:Outer membrane protein beta-barrel domain-containing protein n=1 Tax=Legionella moravica TaxID=39962 RepID=A0A378JX82_9GAMM|nr:hypothetical protein [Legionella moravica]KTD30858.1 hypothetical protein Lmor_2965 [Legionella moravica]STX63315.1 Uncharacterised protein [Legionella moravica]